MDVLSTIYSRLNNLYKPKTITITVSGHSSYDEVTAILSGEGTEPLKVHASSRAWDNPLARALYEMAVLLEAEHLKTNKYAEGE